MKTETALATSAFSLTRTFLATMDMTMTKHPLTTHEREAIGARHSTPYHHRTHSAQQYLIFQLAAHHYGVDILKVRAICGWTPDMVVPILPVAIPGVLNLNGTVVPLIDLRTRFGLASAYGKATSVIVTRTPGEYGKRDIGLVVDSISDVIHVPNNQIQPTLNVRGAVDAVFITGQVNAETGRVMLVDVDHLLCTHELLKLVESDF